MEKIHLNEKLISLLREKIASTERGYIFIAIRSREIAFISFESQETLTAPDEQKSR